MKKKIIIEYPPQSEQNMCDFVFALTELCKDFGIVSIGVETVTEDLENSMNSVSVNLDKKKD